MKRADPPTQGRGSPLKRVKVDEIIPAHSLAICVDTENHRVQVPLHVRRAKGGWPKVGETWLITREFGSWSFASILGDAEPPLITASREGADPLAVQLLDTLLELGLVREPEVDTREDY